MITHKRSRKHNRLWSSGNTFAHRNYEELILRIFFIWINENKYCFHNRALSVYRAAKLSQRIQQERIISDRYWQKNQYHDWDRIERRAHNSAREREEHKRGRRLLLFHQTFQTSRRRVNQIGYVISAKKADRYAFHLIDLVLAKKRDMNTSVYIDCQRRG